MRQRYGTRRGVPPPCASLWAPAAQLVPGDELVPPEVALALAVGVEDGVILIVELNEAVIDPNEAVLDPNEAGVGCPLLGASSIAARWSSWDWGSESHERQSLAAIRELLGSFVRGVLLREGADGVALDVIKHAGAELYWSCFIAKLLLYCFILPYCKSKSNNLF